jgi:uncharacterized membrane protein YqjE
MSSITSLGVIAFLLLVIVWLFVRRGEARDRLFLAVAGILYIAAMFATFWKFGTAEKGKLIGSLLLETAGDAFKKSDEKIKVALPASRVG